MSQDAIGALVSLGLLYVSGAICWSIWWWREAQQSMQIGGSDNEVRQHARKVLATPVWLVLIIGIGVVKAWEWLRVVYRMAQRGRSDR